MRPAAGNTGATPVTSRGGDVRRRISNLGAGAGERTQLPEQGLTVKRANSSDVKDMLAGCFVRLKTVTRAVK